MNWLEVDQDETLKRGRPCYKLNVEAKEAFDDAWTRCMSREGYGVTFNAQLKDEVRVQGKKARVFYMMQFVDMLRHRMVFAFAQFALRLNRDYSENYIGLNCASSDWGKLYHGMLAVSNEGADKDVQEYDMSQKRPMRVAELDGFWVVLAKHLGYSEKDLHAMLSAGIEDCFAYTYVQGDVFLSPGQNNSGSVKTSDDNSAHNSILHRCAWIYLYEQFVKSWSSFLVNISSKYRDNCKLAAFGDDSDEAISPKVQSFYNFKAFKEFFAKFGIVITPARKEEGDYIVKPISECEFLKRGFKETTIYFQDQAHAVVLAPLNLSSIYKSLCYQVASKVVTSEVQTIGAIQSANREFWMHGKEMFDKEHDKLEEAAHSLGYIGKLESYDEITAIYLNGTYATEAT